MIESEDSSLNASVSPVEATQSALDETLTLLSRVIAAAATSIVVTDPRLPDHPIVFHNPAFERVTGYSAREIIGRNCRFMQGKGTDPNVVAEIRSALKEGRSCDVVILNYRKDGERFWNHLYISPVHDRTGKITHFVGVQNDVTVRKEAERERDELLAQQQKVAETLQQALLMNPPARFAGLETAAEFHPIANESQLGGDFYDVFALDEDRVGLVLGDVTGKGLPAARYTAEVKYAVRVLMREYGDVVPALERLNNFVIEAQRLDDRDAYSLVGISLAVFNSETGLLSITTAGMEPALVVRANGLVEEIESVGVVIGLDPNAAYREITRTLEVGDMLVLATDGVTEARGPGRSFFGMEGLIEALRANFNAASLDEVSRAVVRSVEEFSGGNQNDDICVVIARRSAISKP